MSTEIEKSYSFEGVKVLNCDVVFADILISTNDKNKVMVSYISDMEKPEKVVFEIEIIENELVIKEKPLVNELVGSSSLKISFPASSKNLDISVLAASGNVIIENINASLIKAHSASRNISITSTVVRVLKLSTSSGDISCQKIKILTSSDVVTSGGNILLDIPFLPKEHLSAASTSGIVEINIPNLGDNYKIDLMKNENQGGKFIIPFDCDKTVIDKIDKNDSFKTVTCTTIKGSGEPYVRLLTGTGKVKVNTNH